MASWEGGLDDAGERCSVCLDAYTDPRDLHCGHYFCLPCLVTIATGHPDKCITCPMCRRTTDAEVHDLPPHRACADELGLIRARFDLERQRRAVRRRCGFCDLDDLAGEGCVTCGACFCADCREKHAFLEDTAGHQVAPLTSGLFCHQHPGSFVTWACRACDITCCVLCVHAHAPHGVAPLREATEDARISLVAELNVEEGQYERARSWLQRGLGEVGARRAEFSRVTSELRAAAREISDRIEQATMAGEQQYRVAVDELGTRLRELDCRHEQQPVLVEGVEGLLAAMPDAEVLTHTAHSLSETSNRDALFRQQFVHLPVLGGLAHALSDIRKMSHQVELEVEKTPAYSPPLHPLRVKHVCQTGATVSGMTFDDVTQTLLLRTTDVSAPVKVLSIGGDVLNTLGACDPRIAEGCMKGIAMDTKRRVLLLPLENGSLVTMDTEGNPLDTIRVCNRGLNGVTYSERDLYVISSVPVKQIYVIDPVMKAPVASFKHDSTFSFPFHVASVPHSVGGLSRGQLLVSDTYRHCVKLLDPEGRLLHVYGKERSCGRGRDGCLFSPQGACVDPGGRMLVCDTQNSRLVAFSTAEEADGDDRWEVVLGPEALCSGKDVSGRPCHVVCDWAARNVYVADASGMVYVLEEDF